MALFLHHVQAGAPILVLPETIGQSARRVSVFIVSYMPTVRIAFVVFCLIFAAASSVAAQEVVRIKTSLVNLNAVVVDRRGRRVSGLTREDFEVYEDGVLQ